MTFEEALNKLEEIVRRLEEGNLPLDQTVALFEEGTKLARLCNERLDAAELRVTQLVQSAGGYVERDLPLDATNSAESTA